MEKQIVGKKLRWSVAKAMSCVCETVHNSKLRIKETNDYKKAMERLTSLYGLTAVQIWILCLVCEQYFNSNNSTSMRDLSEAVGTPAMSIIGWKADVQSLIERGFLEWDQYNVEFQPVREFCDSLYDNAVFVPQEKHEMDEIEFLNTFAEKYESRRHENMRAFQKRHELMRYERNHENLDMIKRVIKEIETPVNRFILYDVANDVLEGNESGLNETISDLYDGNERYNVAKEMNGRKARTVHERPHRIHEERQSFRSGNLAHGKRQETRSRRESGFVRGCPQRQEPHQSGRHTG